MRAFSLVVEGGFCLIAMCGNAHPKLLCSGGCSLVVARLLLSDIGRGRLFDLQQGGRLCLQWRGPPLGAVSVVSTSVVVTGHSSVSAGGLLAHCGHRLFLSCGTGPLSSSGGHPGLYSSSGSASSGGSLWGGCSLPGSSPGGSRVIRRWGDDVSVLAKYIFNYRYIERLEMDSVVGRLVEENRLNNLDYVEEHPCSRWEFSQKNEEQERMTWGYQSFRKLIRFLYF